MSEDSNLDELDRQILAALLVDGRVSFTDLADKFSVSNGTIHVRVNKMKEAGILCGTTAVIDPRKAGFGVACYVGIKLHNARDSSKVLEKIRKITQITEASYTTGQYSLFLRVLVKTVDELHAFLVDELQPISEIQSTETLIILDQPINRPISL